jgi:hypothetical protein
MYDSEAHHFVTSFERAYPYHDALLCLISFSLDAKNPLIAVAGLKGSNPNTALNASYGQTTYYE